MTNKDQPIPTLFPQGDPLPEQFKKYFIGNCYLNMLVPHSSPLGCPIANVTFEPGTRNNWHRHPGGQVLLVTAGQGWYQEKGKEARKLHAGDVVEIPANVKHWHGAAKESWFSHIAIETNPKAGPVEWMEPVSDEEYLKLR